MMDKLINVPLIIPTTLWNFRQILHLPNSFIIYYYSSSQKAADLEHALYYLQNLLFYEELNLTISKSNHN